jgi:hypothetical protein
MDPSTIIFLSFWGYIASVVTAIFSALFKKSAICWGSLSASLVITIALLVIGLTENDSHGTGLDGLGLAMLIVTPIALVITGIAAAICLWLLNRNVSNHS